MKEKKQRSARSFFSFQILEDSASECPGACEGFSELGQSRQTPPFIRLQAELGAQAGAFAHAQCVIDRLRFPASSLEFKGDQTAMASTAPH